MKKASIIVLILSIFLQLFSAPTVLSQSFPVVNSIQSNSTLLRVVIVLDISGSMQSYSLGGSDLPDKIAELKSQMDGILNSQTHRDLLDKRKTLLANENLVSASRIMYEKYDLLEEWYSSKGYGSISDVQAAVNNILVVNKCKENYSYWITISDNVQDMEERLSYACEATTSSDISNAILKAFPVDNPELSGLISEVNQAESNYYDAQNAVGVSALNEEITNYLDTAGYYGLQSEVEELAPSYNIPTKMDLAKQAAQILVELSKLDQLSQGIASEVSIVTFSDTAKLEIPLTSNFEQVESIIQTLVTMNMTNISDGLITAMDQLEPAASDGQPSVIILLSDGYANRGLVSQDMLNSIPERAKSIGTTVYTVGIGETEYDVDSDLLTGLAEQSGGSYLFAQSGEELVNFFIESRQKAVGGSVTSFTGSIQQGERQQVGSVPVEKDLDELSLTLSHLEGDLIMRLIDPDGEEVTTGYPGMSDQEGGNVQLIKIKEPKKGNWMIEVEARSIPSEKKSVIYTVVASQSARKITPTPVPSPTPTPSFSFIEQYKWYLVGGGLCIFGVIALIAVVVVVIILVRRKPKR